MIPIKSVQRAVSALMELPGVGPKTAQRYVEALLDRPGAAVPRLVDALKGLLEGVKTCSLCRGWDERDPCRFCADPGRDGAILMVVASPRDVYLIEETGAFRGRYFVLGGVISPLEGIGPADLGIGPLLARIGETGVREVIVGLDPTLEGEATTAYLTPVLKKSGARVTRLARGVPMGGDLELLDRGTLGRAIAGRQGLGE